MLSILPKKSRAILIGSSVFPEDEEHLPPLPAVKNNVKKLSEILANPQVIGIPTQNLSCIFDEFNAGKITEKVSQIAKQAEDTLIIYYAGHGLIGRSGVSVGKLFLAVKDTTDPGATYNALQFEVLQDAIRDSPAKKKILIIDCCFSGRALPQMGNASNLLTAHINIKGVYVITSSPANKPSIAPEGDEYTAFSGKLIEVLTKGVDNQNKVINLEEIYKFVREELLKEGMPEPQRANLHDANKINIAFNQKFRPFISLSTIFLSDSDDPLVREYRQAAKHVIEHDFSLKWNVLDRQDISLGNIPSPEICSKVASSCGLFILFLGDFYGNIYFEHNLSYTEYEYRVAEEQNCKILVFTLPDDPYPSLSREYLLEQASLMSRQVEFLQYLQSKSSLPIKRVTDIRNLEQQLRDYLNDLNYEQETSTNTTDTADAESPQIINFLGECAHLNYDRLPVLSHKLSDLDDEAIKIFLKQPQSQRLLDLYKISRTTEEDHLKELGVINNDGKITLGFFLCFAPRSLLVDKFASCSLQMVVYSDIKKATARTKQLETPKDNLLNLFQIGMRFLKAEAGLQLIGQIGTDKRDELEIPEIALREALANALVHRDYQKKELKDQPTRIEVYPDRLEITSYGRLLDEVSEDALNNNPEQVKPYRRNYIITEIFRIMQNAELNASGISRIYEAAKQANLPSPNIIESEETSTVTVIFRRRQPANVLEKLNYQNIDVLVDELRDHLRPYIQTRCGAMRVLDMNQPITLDSIYTSVNVLERVAGQRRLEISDLLQEGNLENFDRFGLGAIREKWVSGLEAIEKYSKLMILGKPGAGKTTFLKHLAVQCIEGDFRRNRIPVFITLKEFAESNEQPNLLDYVADQFSSFGIREPRLTAESILSEGKGLILLDGLDEVREEDISRILKELNFLTSKYDKNGFAVTCRLAALEYTFSQFTEVEISDFDQDQIHSFIAKWFRAKNDEIKSKALIQKLNNNARIEELATNPLLLTLLCLVFEDFADFPSNRSELYKEAIDVLLKKWDAKRNIERDKFYKGLSLHRKEDLLSQIAFDAFERGEYFFKQKLVESQIQKYIRNFSEVNIDLEAIQLDSESILKSIEAQHGLLVERARGIYSFSHITFQEYFTARKVVASLHPEALLQRLTPHVFEKRWREVILLTLEMLPEAGFLIQFLKRQIDVMLSADDQFQQFLSWVDQKSRSVNLPYKLTAVRAFYFAFDFARTLDIDFDRTFDPYLAHALDFRIERASYFEIDVDLTRVLDRANQLSHDFDSALARAFIRALTRVCTLDFDTELKSRLQELKGELPNVSSERWETMFKQWWEVNGVTWLEQLRHALIEHRNIGHDWKFSDSQIALLQQYHNGCKFLVECLNSDCYVTRQVRDEIEETLLLPLVDSSN